MFRSPTPSPDRPELLQIVSQVRSRWRLKMALRGAAGVLGGSLLGLALAAGALEYLRFTPASIITFRIAIFLLLAGLALWLLVLPLRRRVSDGQVALYLEEHEPSLDAAVVSAVDATAGEAGAPVSLQSSPALVRELVEAAVAKCEAVDAGRRVEATRLRRYWAALSAGLATAFLLILFGPAYLRHGASALLLVARSVEAASPYRIEVRPGDATVPRGSDQTISARLEGFRSEQVELLVRREPTAPFERLPMIAAESGAYESMLFNLPGPVDYIVESAGVRSPRFTLKVADVPYVKQLELEFRFPAYTGLKPRRIDNGGDIAVLRGTEVRMRVVPTMITAGGRVLVHGADSLALAREGEAFTAQLTVDRSGSYRIDLESPAGTLGAASPQYTIDALDDQPPLVSIAKPGRDTTATPLEEFFVEARADDDFGIRQLQLVYSLNGGPQQTRTLFDSAKRPLAEVSGGHTFYLEELGAAPGDSMSYFARATDNRQVGTPNAALSDLYFLQIGPFEKQFRAALSQGGGGGAGGARNQFGGLSDQQKQIVAATFNVVRDRPSLKADKFRDDVVVVGLAQARLREQVEQLVARMNSSLVEPNPAFRKIAETLPKAVAEMRQGEAKLQALAPDAALPPEQRALNFLQQAEEEFEVQVSTGAGGGGGGGAGFGSIAADLRDLFGKELEKQANQYETAQRADQENRDQQVDEQMERLRELARRQQQEVERQRQLASAGQSGQGGGDSQRALADQVEEAARRLERLSREQSRTDVADAARRMQEAADAMRRAAASRDASGAAQAGTALERLREAQRRLEREQGTRAGRDIQDAVRKAEELAAEQGQIAGEVEALSRSGSDRQSRVRQLVERKNALDSKVADLEQQLDKTSGELQRTEREASRRLGEAAESIRENKLKEKIRYSRSVVQGASPDAARAFEREIGENLEALRQKIGQAASAVGSSAEDKMADALDRARNLTRGMESLSERMRERAEQARSARQQAQAGREGRAGQAQGQQGQGQAGQQGQGQGGQQGQGQGGQQGGRGQQGQGGDLSARGGNGAFGPRGRDDGNGGGYGGPWDYPWGYSGDDIRQYRGEIRQWTSETRELRDRLRNQNIDAATLDEILKALRELDSDRVYKDPEELERLQTFVTESLKRFEFGLRRKAETPDEHLTLAGADEVPRGFRQLVEEYYRALSQRNR